MDILEAVKRHHELVEEKGHIVIMTSLIGSQNYGLADDKSDIDTFSLTLPAFKDLASAREPVSKEFEVDDGKCVYKDIRIALNLLKKTSPNSAEVFLSNWIYFNPIYEECLKEYLMNDMYLNYAVHSNYQHMLYACAGMAHQLTKRNMPAGKRYAHALRLKEMAYKYVDNFTVKDLFHLPEKVKQLALKAKRDPEHDEQYNDGCTSLANWLDAYLEAFNSKEVTVYNMEEIEHIGDLIISNCQVELLREYLKGEY